MKAYFFFKAVFGIVTASLIFSIPARTTGQDAQSPLSAIDWLSQATDGTARPSLDRKLLNPNNTAALSGAIQPSSSKTGLSVSNLELNIANTAGPLPPNASGLPQDLWNKGHEHNIIEQISQLSVQELPTLQNVQLRLLLANTDPLGNGNGGIGLLLARLDKLIEIGALKQAIALIDAANIKTEAIILRSFDIHLLMRNDKEACEVIKAYSGQNLDLLIRVFCLVQSGNYDTAEIAFRTENALGRVSTDQRNVLEYFLYSNAPGQTTQPVPNKPKIPSPAKMTGLSYRLYEKIGFFENTNKLPLRFSYAEMVGSGGWKKRLESAERLAKAGAIPPEAMLRMYNQRSPAASGGIWDRVMIVQKVSAYLRQNNAGALSQILPMAWKKMKQSGMAPVFANMFGAALSAYDLEAIAAQRAAFEIALISSHYARNITLYLPQDSLEIILKGMATDTLSAEQLSGLPINNITSQAILRGYYFPVTTPQFEILQQEGRAGEALMLAIQKIGSGLDRNPNDISEAISFLKENGYSNLAHKISIEALLLQKD